MDRLQKKCFLATTGVHLLLLVLMLVGPGFLSRKNPVDDLPILDFIPARLVDAPFSSGGTPVAPPPTPEPQPPRPSPPVVAPPVVTPPPQPQPVVKLPEPSPPKPQPAPPAPKAVEKTPVPEKPEPRKPVVSTKLVTRTPEAAAKERAQREAEAARAAAREREKLANQIGRSISTLRQNFTPTTTIEEVGTGGGGPAYASYAQIVRSRYTLAWRPPEDLDDESAKVRVTVTIARDGTVLSARIVEPSGNAVMDRSIRQTLEEVTFIAPFPEGVKEERRTYTIVFNLRARRMLG